MTAIHASLALLGALLTGTFVEYWGHRLMHSGRLLKKRHGGHHARGTGQGWLKEFRDYFLPTVLIIWVGFLVSPAAGWGFLVGTFAYAAGASFAHQLQHEHPELVFWMRPVHSVHHYNNEWHHNFGILVDWWDRVFGTYKESELPPAWQVRRFAPVAMLRIHLNSVSSPLPKRPRGQGSA